MQIDESRRNAIRENFKVAPDFFLKEIETGFTHNGGYTPTKYVIEWMVIFKQFDIRDIRFHTSAEKNSNFYHAHQMYFAAGQKGKEYQVSSKWDMERCVVGDTIFGQKGEPIDIGDFLGCLLQSIGLPCDVTADRGNVAQKEIKALFQNFLFKKGMNHLNRITKNNMDIQEVTAFLNRTKKTVYKVTMKVKRTIYVFHVDFEGKYGATFLSTETEEGVSYQVCQKVYRQLKRDFKKVGFQEIESIAFLLISETIFSEIKEKYKASKECQLKQRFTAKPIINY